MLILCSEETDPRTFGKLLRHGRFDSHDSRCRSYDVCVFDRVLVFTRFFTQADAQRHRKPKVVGRFAVQQILYLHPDDGEQCHIT